MPASRSMSAVAVAAGLVSFPQQTGRRRVGSRARARAWFDGADFSLHPTNVEEALGTLEGVARALRAEDDPRAAFPDIYGIITRRVGEQIALGRDGLFQEPQWISKLAGRFGRRYMDTLRWSFEHRTQDTNAWGVTYACAEEGSVFPLQHVLLGLSAHINFDLAIGIYRTILDEGRHHDPAVLARYKHDHDAVNELLHASIPDALHHLVERYRCPATTVLQQRAYRLVEWSTMHLLTTWRTRVWDDAVALLEAQSDAQRDRVIEQMERRSHRIALVLAMSARESEPREWSALDIAA